MALGLTQPLTEMSTSNISWRERRPVMGLLYLYPYHLCYPLRTPIICPKMFALEQATNAQMGKRGIALLFL
jgi:hypothetical protein